MSDKLKKFLALFDEKTKERRGNVNHGADRALFLLLSRWKDKLPDLDNDLWFVKTFRVADVTDDVQTDMAIWNLLNQSKMFWRVFEEVQGEKDLEDTK